MTFLMATCTRRRGWITQDSAVSRATDAALSYMRGITGVHHRTHVVSGPTVAADVLGYARKIAVFPDRKLLIGCCGGGPGYVEFVDAVKTSGADIDELGCRIHEIWSSLPSECRTASVLQLVAVGYSAGSNRVRMFAATDNDGLHPRPCHFALSPNPYLYEHKARILLLWVPAIFLGWGTETLHVMVARNARRASEEGDFGGHSAIGGPIHVGTVTSYGAEVHEAEELGECRT